MSTTPKLAEPCTLVLHRRVLGEGGNGKVYEAHHQAAPDVPVAVKVLERKGEEAYKRFQYEVEAHKIIGSHPGVLPLQDARIPAYSSDEAPWLVMPVATSIRQALGPSPELEKVVAAIEEIASTLSDLKEKHGMSHRDIKPENLFEYGGRYVIGDLGLVSFPGKEVLTEPGDRVGAANFQAPETLNHPETAKGEPADVHALAKTLWVLAKPWRDGKPEKWPDPGPQRRDYPQMRLGTYINHPRIVPIELLLERATHPIPDERPTLEEIRYELGEWLKTSEEAPITPDFTGIQEAYDFLTDMDRRQRDEAEERYVIIRDIGKRLKGRLTPLIDSLSSFKGNYVAVRENMGGAITYGLDPAYPEDQPSLTSNTIVIAITSPLMEGNNTLSYHAYMEIMSLQSGKDYLVAALLVFDPFQPPQGDPNKPSVLWLESAIVQRGTATEENTLDRLAKELVDRFPSTFQEFMQRIALRLQTHSKGQNY